MVKAPVVMKRELNALFLSPTAYVVLTAFAFGQGLFVLGLRAPVEPVWTVQSLFGWSQYLLMVAAPVLTMRLLSAEVRSGTIEALMTTPVTEMEVVLGKFSAVLVFGVVLLLPVVGQTLCLSLLGNVDAGAALAGFMGLFLLTAQFLAVGLLCSALTRTQTASAIVAFVVLIALYFLWTVSWAEPGVAAALARYVSPPGHFKNFTRGLVDTRDLTYFVVTTALLVSLAVKSLQLRKWR
ncbi:MAG: ABC transporter permease [Planctomycetota bacterium]